jgi:hypothetical protein
MQERGIRLRIYEDQEYAREKTTSTSTARRESKSKRNRRDGEKEYAGERREAETDQSRMYRKERIESNTEITDREKRMEPGLSSRRRVVFKVRRIACLCVGVSEARRENQRPCAERSQAWRASETP